jgi:RNA polymerase sigma factor for flagellar operon FliA
MIKKIEAYSSAVRFKQDQIAVDYLPAVKAMAYRLKERLPSSVEVADLISIGAEELVKLSRRFDETLNESFWGYAKQRVYGSMLDYLRSLDVVSRGDRKMIKEVEHATLVYFNEHEEEPSDQDLATILDEDIEKIREARRGASYYNVLPLDEQVRVFESQTTLETIEREQLIHVIGKIMMTLSEKEQMVIQLYYFEELTFKEISEILEITESRISQIHKAVIGKIRSTLVETGGI